MIHQGSLDVQNYSETMATQGSSSNKQIFMCEQEDISNCTIVITWFEVVLHEWNKGQLRHMYIIDGVCWTLLQLQILDAPGSIYTKYASI